MNKRMLISLVACTLGWAGGTGRSPVPGSGRPDAFARPGQTLTMAVPRTPVSPPRRVRLVVPDLPPGRTLLPVPVRGARPVEVDILPPTSGGVSYRAVTMPGTPFPPENVRPDQVQVLLNPALAGADLTNRLGKLEATYGKVSQELLPGTYTPAKTRVSGAPDGSPCGGTLVTIDLRPGLSVEDALNGLLAETGDDIWYPDPISSPGLPALQTPPVPPSRTIGQPSPSRTLQGFHYAGRDAVQPVSPRRALGTPSPKLTGSGVTVAVLDTGFSSNLDLLRELSDGQTTPAARVRPMNALLPFDAATAFNPAFLASTLDFWEGHGTQVAILAAGSRTGVAPQAGVLPIKVCAPGADGRAACSTRNVLRGICFALHEVPADHLILNLSLGGAVSNNAIHAALNWAEQQGTVVVAAGGNQGLNGNPPEFPAAFARPTVGSQTQLKLLAVASVTPGSPSAWTYSAFTTQGTYLNVSAPGEALDIGHPYVYSGTSFAAPLVAGAAALVRGAGLNAVTTQQVAANALAQGTTTGPQAVTVKAFMLAPVRTWLFSGIQPMLDLSKY